MAKMDLAHRETDKLIEDLEKRIDETYARAAKETQAKLDKYLKSFEKKDAEKKKLVDAKQMKQSEYEKWRIGQVMTGKRWEEMSKTLATDLAHADYIAQKITQDSMIDAYALNHNYATYEVEKGSMVDTSYTMYDHDTAERLIAKEPQLLPKASEKTEQKIREGKLIRWNQQKITSEVTQSILQGESVDKMARRMRNVTDMDRRASIRNARTSMTGAQNAGRQEGYERAQEMGIDLVKTWLATMDDRTRHWHVELDGVSVPVDESFENEYGLIEYPGDPNADPANVYNCRCTMISTLKGFEKDFSDRTNEALGDMSYEDWKQMHAEKQAEHGYVREPAAEVIETAKVTELHTDDLESYETLQSAIDSNNVYSLNVQELSKPLTSDEIIDKIAGGDMTKGSCASLGFAYVGNQCGLDVTDFRGGDSRYVFSHHFKEMIKVSNADLQTHVVKTELKGATDFVKSIPKDKEIYFVAGRHAAIIRNSTEFGLQYLELQSKKENGWKAFGETDYEISTKLKYRFKCQKSPRTTRLGGKTYKLESRIYSADVDSFKPTAEFKEMLGYLNTASDKQQKGETGYAK